MQTVRATGIARCRPGVAAARPRRACIKVCAKLILAPTGSGNTEHLGGEKINLPPVIELRNGTLDVGRVEPCDVIIAIPTVSSRHAILTVEGDKVLVIDVNSTNGTSVNGADLKPMDSVELPIGGEVIFGDENLARFRLVKLSDDVPNASMASTTSE